MDLNRVTIIGRLTRDPEVRTTPNGKSVASMSIATGRTWVDQSGAKQEKTEFHNCVLWGKLGEIAGQYLAKGRKVYIEGRLETRDWTGTDGVKKYRTEIIADSVQFGPKSGGASTGEGYTPSATNATPAPTAVPDLDTIDYGDTNVNIDDIPF